MDTRLVLLLKVIVGVFAEAAGLLAMPFTEPTLWRWFARILPC